MPGNLKGQGNIGRTIRTLPGVTTVLMHRFGPDGNYVDGDTSTRRLQPGETGEITDYASHGSDPYTRYTVRFPDGWTASGIAPRESLSAAARTSSSCLPRIRPAGNTNLAHLVPTGSYQMG